MKIVSGFYVLKSPWEALSQIDLSDCWWAMCSGVLTGGLRGEKDI